MRKIITINEGWVFGIKNTHQEEYIKLPHTWNNMDGQDGGNDYFRGIGHYKKRVECEDLISTERVFLEFLGANSSTRVMINGVEKAYHEGGYSTFRVEVTSEVHCNRGIVEVDVLVDNSYQKHIYPQKADFTFYGGLYRDVNLIRVSSSHFSLMDQGSQGIYITPTIEGEIIKLETGEWHCEKVNLQVRAIIDGDYDQLRYTLCKEDKVVLSWETEENESTQVMEDVRLWNGLMDPFLYQLQVELLHKGAIVDEITQSFGCRSFDFDPEQGFLLNRSVYPLRGVSRHQDRRDIGNALSKAMHKEDMDIIVEMGANSLRLAHYQHDPYFYELCDSIGMIVWAEIPYISEHVPEGNQNTVIQLTELICQNYNRASIAVWGLSNEITVTKITEDLIYNHRVLNELAHQLDATRKTVMAHVFMLPTNHEIVQLPDVMAYNLYYGWYLGNLEENDQFFDRFHAEYPQLMVGLSEYGADCNIVFQNPKPYRGDYSEQYQCAYHEHMLEMIEKRPYLWCTYLWNMFDFGADGRDEAEDFGVNHKGVVTFDRKEKKDAYYLYKAHWSKEPFLHLCGRRYVERCEDYTEIKVYSNLEKIRLYMDDLFIEEKSGKERFEFTIAISGSHKIEARGESLIEGSEFADTIWIEKVGEPNKSYTLECAAIHNWFDDPDMKVIDGFYSVQDTIGDIQKSEEGRQYLDVMMAHALKARGDVAQNLERNEAIEKMIYQSTVIDFVKLAGGSINQEMVIELNQKLTMIKKVEEMI